MIRVFLDTSAILALLNPKDEHHGRARRVFEHAFAFDPRFEDEGSSLLR